MTTNVKNIRLGDMIFQRQGSFALRLLQFVFSITLRIFFRRIELVNVNKIPETGGSIFVMNHPNALIDAAVIFFTLPRKVSFLAKSTIFKVPIIGYLARTIEALPVYRQSDAAKDMEKNKETFRSCREILKKGGIIGLFPEGVSHNTPKLLPLKTGASRIALGAVSVGQNPDAVIVQIVPVGLFYTSKTTFRSEVLLYFGEPFRVLPVALDEDGQPPRAAVKELTEKIEESLRQITLNAESETELRTANIAEEIFSSVAEETDSAATLAEKFDFVKNYVKDKKLENNSQISDEKFETRLSEYDKKLANLGLEPENLSLSEYSKWFVFKRTLERSWYLLILSPLALIGVIIHFPAYQINKFLAYLQFRKGDYDMVSTVKLLGGIVLMPLTWIILAITLYFYWNWQIALLSIPFSFLCGYIALRVSEEIVDMRGWLNAILLFVGKREKFLRLLIERRRLREELKRFD